MHLHTCLHRKEAMVKLKMGKSNVEYVCENCDAVAVRYTWVNVPHGEYNTYVFSPKSAKGECSQTGSKHEARTSIIQSSANEAIPLTDIRTEDWKKIKLGSDELNTVLGGGLTPGSVVLLGGAPGLLKVL